MKASSAMKDVAIPRGSRPSLRGWSWRRRLFSLGALIVVLTGAFSFAWRASLAPLELWTHAEQCAGAPDAATDTLFGLAVSSDLRGASQITILNIDTIAALGAHSPTYWVVPVTDGSGGTGSGTTADPPPHWSQRVSAVGAVLQRDRPANLLVELQPDHGHALLGQIAVTYRTPDGFVHTAAGDAGMEVDTTGACRNTTGPIPHRHHPRAISGAPGASATQLAEVLASVTADSET